MATWSVPIEALAAKTKARIEDVVRKVTYDLFRSIIVASPVDTGRFRANWNISYGAIDTTINNSTNSADALRKLGGVARSPVGHIVYLCNSLPYALVLENGGYPNPPKFGSKKRGEDGMTIHVRGGYSMQAPAGMVRVTVRAFEDFVRKALAS